MIHDMPISIHPVSCSIIRSVRYGASNLSHSFSLPPSSPLSFYLLLLMFTFFASACYFFLLCCEHILSYFRYFHSIVCKCEYPKFLENENHISIIQRLVTETHSYSGRSRLTPVNPKIGNESCSCCCWCHCCWCESKRRVWKKICRTNMKQQILAHKNMENKLTRR